MLGQVAVRVDSAGPPPTTGCHYCNLSELAKYYHWDYLYRTSMVLIPDIVPDM